MGVQARTSCGARGGLAAGASSWFAWPPWHPTGFAQPLSLPTVDNRCFGCFAITATQALVLINDTLNELIAKCKKLVRG